jgi:hypothetical protein
MILTLDPTTTRWLTETLNSLECLQNYHVKGDPEIAQRHLVKHHGFVWLKSPSALVVDRSEVARWTKTGSGEHVRISVWYEEDWKVEMHGDTEDRQ